MKISQEILETQIQMDLLFYWLGICKFTKAKAFKNYYENRKYTV